MNFYVFRHGQTDWNREFRIQGSSNIPLNETGREQALELALKFKRINLDVVVSSDLDRAFDTGAEVARVAGVQIFREPRLREAFFGEAEGKTVDEIIATYGRDMWKNFRKMNSENKNQCFPGGETRWDSVQRMRSVIDDFVEEGKYQNIGVSTHGGVVRNLLHSYLPENTDPIAIPNCVLYILEWNSGEFKVKGPL